MPTLKPDVVYQEFKPQALFFRPCYNMNGKRKKSFKTEDLAWRSGLGKPYRCPGIAPHNHGWHVSSCSPKEDS